MWTICFIIKLVLTRIGLDIWKSHFTDENYTLAKSLLVTIFSILTEMVPLYKVLEGSYIKAFSMQYLVTLQNQGLFDIEEYDSFN